MTTLIKSALLAVAALALVPSAFADTHGYGNAQRETAASGQITPHGVWDGK